MANSYLNKTFSGNGSTTKFTASFWVKRSKIGARQEVIAKWSSGSNNTTIRFLDDDTLAFVDYASSTTVLGKTTNRKFRDTSAWYHIVCNIDTTQASSDDRAKIYVNGVQETSFASNTVYSQNASTNWNNTWSNQIGWSGNDGYFEGYISHVALVDGQALAPTVFGETDSTSGIWKFKSPSGVTWGTNGFHLKFENSAALGTDSSGNSNTFTVNGNGRQALDTPSNVYATANPLHFNATIPSAGTLSNGNLTFTSSQGGSAYPAMYSTMAVSQGKWYAEFKVTTANSAIIGIGSGIPSGGFFGGGVYDYAYYYDGAFYNNGGNTGSQSSYTDGDIISVAMDLDNNKVYVAKNNTWQHSGNPSASSGGYTITAPSSTNTGVYHIAYGDSGGGTPTIQGNFGNGYFGTTAISSAGSNGNGSLFEYDVPSGYYALNTKNINTYG